MVQDAFDFFSDASPEARGAVHTRPEVTEFILDAVGWRKKEEDLVSLRLLEPSAGQGDFLVPAADRLLSSTKPGNMDVANCIRAVEVNTAALKVCRGRLLDLFARHKWETRTANRILEHWLLHADFLTAPLHADFTHVVGNPPYVRLEHLPKELLRLYRSQWRSLFDRADLYVAFIEKSLGLLRPMGRLGFICADRWMKNRYGGPLREIVGNGFHLHAYVDFTGCPAFFDEVDAYPAVTVIRKSTGTSTRVAFRPEIDPITLSRLADAIYFEKQHPEVRIISGVTNGSNPWTFDEDGLLSIVRKLESCFPPLEQAGCKVGIGVATGADAVFIGNEEQLDVEAERRLPLVTTRDIRNGAVNWGGKWVLNPFETNGTLVDLGDWPRFRAYLEKNKAAILKRNVARRNPIGWFRTIDRIHPGLTQTPKLLIPDIKGSAHVVYDAGAFYPHHNLYYVTSSDWPLRALQTVLSSRIAQAFVAAYSPRMRGNFLRFQAQYLRRVRLPQWADVQRKVGLDLETAAVSGDARLAATSVCRLYGLTDSEWKILGGEPGSPRC
ncbi:MAG: modification methylase PaeR7I [Puniceicoccaceae bacterium]|nr:MAG: modification methylase PaeR7I [Puniceicoccaceae bacterium]